MTDVSGRIAFITGGGNGIGLGIARSLARSGVRLALADVDSAALGRAKEELQAITAVEAYALDVRDRAAYAATAELVEDALGPVSLLFNNAGIAGGGPAAKLSYELWDWYIGVNLEGVINGIQTFLPRMATRGLGGHIVNTASGAGLVNAGSGVLYTTTKFGVVGLSETLHLELAGSGIGVSVLCPGPVDTGIIQRSADTTPKIQTELSDAQKKLGAERVAMMTEYLKNGVSIDDVGKMVLTAVERNSLYIHTDRAAEEMIKERTRALLEAMPA